MKSTYSNLINQTYKFPQDAFALHDDWLTFHGIPLKELIHKYETPFRFIYLPKIGEQISKARSLFDQSFRKHDYNGKYRYCYCTKCNHYAHVIGETLKHNVRLEISSALDIDIVLNLFHHKKIDAGHEIIANGYKTDEYLSRIALLYQSGFTNMIVVLDNKDELERLLEISGQQELKIGLRMAINEEPQASFWTSRLGIRSDEILDFYINSIKRNSRVNLRMLHFFVDSGIEDSMYYWGEFQRCLDLYVELKKECPSLDAFNIGGGFPIRNNLGFDYDYSYMIDEIVRNIKKACVADEVKEPDIYTEFGKYTVGECGAVIFKVLDQKDQNDKEKWYIIDNSLMSTIPDAWSIHEKFILLPINKWDREYTRVNIGGISCDHWDYYNSEGFNQEILLPVISGEETSPFYLGFFHTGAYQDALSGYGGMKHCLIPSPKYVIIDRDKDGNLIDYMYPNEYSGEDIYQTLGYDPV